MRRVALAVASSLLVVLLASGVAYGLLTYYMRWSEQSMMCSDALERRRNHEANFMTAYIAASDPRITHADFMGTAIKYRDDATTSIDEFCPPWVYDSTHKYGRTSR